MVTLPITVASGWTYASGSISGLDVDRGRRWPRTDPTGERGRPPIPKNHGRGDHDRTTVTPKELGKHLRTVRRKKGLSLSEVARGAGLSRRELGGVRARQGPDPRERPVGPRRIVRRRRGRADARARRRWSWCSPPHTTTSSATPSASSAATRRIRASRRTSHTLHKLQSLPPGKRIPVKERELDAIAVALGDHRQPSSRSSRRCCTSRPTRPSGSGR